MITKVSAPPSQSSFQVYWQGNILVVKPKGPFSLNGVQRVSEAVKKCIQNRPSGSWVRLYLFEDMFTLGPIESVPVVVETMRHSMELGCEHLLVVGGNWINRDSLIDICKRANMPLSFCDSYPEALSLAESIITESVTSE